MLDLNIPYETSKNGKLVFGRKVLFAIGGEKNYIHALITDNLIKKSLYCLHIDNATVNDDKYKTYTVLVKDEKMMNVRLNCKCVFNNSTTIFLSTSEETDKLELRIYAGNPTQTSGVEISLSNVTLFRM